MNTKLIKLLMDGQYHSTQQIANHLGISYFQTKKLLMSLENYTLHLKKTRGRGYQLTAPIDLLDSDFLNQSIKNYPIFVFDSLESTNTKCIEILKEKKLPSFIVTAEQQTKGRGRHGKEWISPFAQNIYYSLLITLNNLTQQANGLSLTVGLAVLKTLKELGVQNAGLKWPNDILVNNKKISGILLELQSSPTSSSHVIIGIGINANMQHTTKQITQAWTSIQQELGTFIDRNQAIALLSNNLNRYITIHLQQGFKSLKAEWDTNNLWKNKMVYILVDNQQIEGKMIGVDNDGTLLLEINNTIQHFNAGEVSLRLAH